MDGTIRVGVAKGELMGRLLIGKILLFLALPFVFLGLIDPLEGGLALIVAAVIYLVGFLLLRRFPTKLLWISFSVAILVGAAALVMAIMRLDFTNQPQPISFPLIALLWAYRVAVLVTLAAGIREAVRLLRK